MVIEATTRARADVPIGLVMVGDGIDRARVRRAAAGKAHFHLIPPIRDRGLLAAHLASADVLVHGCDSETFGLLPAEAMASVFHEPYPARATVQVSALPKGALVEVDAVLVLPE